jgi:hypothetical protein
MVSHRQGTKSQGKKDIYRENPAISDSVQPTASREEMDEAVPAAGGSRGFLNIAATRVSDFPAMIASLLLMTAAALVLRGVVASPAPVPVRVRANRPSRTRR